MAKCKKGCTCKRHTSPKIYQGGKKLSPESIAKRQATRMKNMDQIAMKTSETLKRKHREDTEFREGFLSMIRDPERLQRVSESTKKEWQDPEKRKNHLDGIQRHLADEESRRSAFQQRVATRYGEEGPKYQHQDKNTGRVLVYDSKLSTETHPLGPLDTRYRRVLYDAIGPGPHECYWCNQRGKLTLLEWGGRDGIHVDHLNGDPSDDRLENLVVSCCHCNWGREWREANGWQ